MAALKEAARKGRRGDTRLGHLSNGDVVIPREILDEKSRKLVNFFLKTKGHEAGRFTVGHEANQRNPRTRLPEFEGTGAEGTGEGPGAAGGVGGTGPGGGGTGGPGNGASAGGNGVGSSSGVASSSALDGMAVSGARPGGEIGTGHDLGMSNHGIGFGGSTEGEMANMGGTPTASIGEQVAGFLGSQLSKMGVDVDIDNNQVGFNPTGIGLNQNLAATAINGLIGLTPAGLVNMGLGFVGHDIGHSVVSGFNGMMNGGISAGTPTGTAGAGGDIGGGAGLDSLGGNIGMGFDDSLLKRRLRES